jgi:hypothetical protein
LASRLNDPAASVARVGTARLLLLPAVLLQLSCLAGDAKLQYCRESTESGYCQATKVSLATILNKPDAFHGKRVKVVGYAHVGPDRQGLYPSKADYDEWKSKRGLWLDLPRPAREPIDHAVEIEGTFDKDNAGQRGDWGGAMTNIFEIKKIENVEPGQD